MNENQLPVLKIAKPGWPIILCSLGATTLSLTMAINDQSAGLAALGMGSLILMSIALWFYRDPDRKIDGQQLIALGGHRKPILAPADGRLTDMTELPAVNGQPMIRLGFFLSPLNVHVQWVPLEGKVAHVERKNGKCLPAYKPEAAHENAMSSVSIEHKYLGLCVVRQITGLLARRILTWTKIGSSLKFGQRLGMILLGSRVELEIPKNKIKLHIKLSDMVYAGESVIASYESEF